MRCGQLIPAVALGLCFLFVFDAQAANSKVSALVKEGDKLYKQNKYREAAETLKKAYDIEPSPVLLYNIARAYDQAGELKLALDTYRQFVGMEGSDQALMKKANLAMDRLRTLVAKDEAAAQQQEAEKKRLEDEAKASREKAEAEAARAQAQKADYEAKEKARLEASQKKANTRLVASLVIGGVAVAGLGAGIGFGLAANGSKSGFGKATTVADKQRLESATKSQSLIADVSFGVALAAAITAVIVFPKGSSTPEPEKSVQVVFAPVTGGGLVGIGGRF